MSLDLAVDYQSERAEWARTEFQIYMLQHEPEPVSHKEYKQFSQGNHGDNMKGFQIKVIGMPKQKGPHNSDNLVLFYEYDNSGVPINKSKPNCKFSKKVQIDTCLAYLDCHESWQRAIFRIESDIDRQLITLEIKKDNDQEWTQCLQYNSAIDWHVHTYITSGSTIENSTPTSRAVTLNSIKFYDNEVAQMEGEQADYINDQRQYRDFEGTAQDLLHLGNVDGAILKDEALGRSGYNDKLLKYNSKYA